MVGICLLFLNFVFYWTYPMDYSCLQPEEGVRFCSFADPKLIAIIITIPVLVVLTYLYVSYLKIIWSGFDENN